ncbi:hypothetical protein ACS0TY_005080 [Phlomoides rotata]
MENLLNNLSLSVEEDDEIVFKSEGLEGQGSDLQLCLVGRFLTDKNLTFGLVQSH